MEIALAEVTERFDPEREGRFLANLIHKGPRTISVTLTTPWLGYTFGAMNGHVPAKGAVVLVCQPEGTDSWYYLGASFEKEPTNLVGKVNRPYGLTPKTNRSTDIYGGAGAGTGSPNRVIFQDDAQNGLELVSEKRGDDQAFNYYTRLRSGQGKMIEMNDSPAIDSIVIQTSTGNAKITMGDDEPRNDITPADSYNLTTRGPQMHFNHGSETDIVVLKGGGDLNLLNKGTGERELSNGKQAGSVNIQSDAKDVNIFAKQEYSTTDPAKIHIQCLNPDGQNQAIQIKINGDGVIQIQSAGKIEIDSANDIDIRAGGAINMDAGGKISMAGAGIEVDGKGTAINLDGASIDLNSGLTSAQSPTITDIQSRFGNAGVTKY